MFNSWSAIGVNMILSLYLFNFFIISITDGVYYDPNDMGKANVKVSEVLQQNGNEKSNKDKLNGWAPSNSDRYTQVHMRVMGNKIDQTVLFNLRPTMDKRNKRRLNRLLGDYRDQTWSSTKRPYRTRIKGEFQFNRIESKLVVAADALNITLIDESGVRYTLPSHILGKFRDYLKRSATCTMDYIWEDLGPLFWPNWIRRGICVNNVASSCSWPPGMKCRPSGSRKLFILYWKCRLDDGDRELNKRRLRHIARKKRLRKDSRWSKSDKYRRRRRMKRNRIHRDNSMLARKRRHQIRMKRIIRKTSIVRSGYYCKWDVQKYLINDKCSCSCA